MKKTKIFLGALIAILGFAQQSITAGTTSRERVVQRTLVFSRSQLKYGYFQNYYNWWISRPLMHDRSMRYPTGTFKHTMPRSTLKDLELVKSYGIDGLSNGISSNSRLANYKKTIKAAQLAKADHFTILPEFDGGHKLTKDFLELCDATVKTAISSKFSAKINEKPLIISYVADRWKPEQLEKLLSYLRERNGKNFLFIADMVLATSPIRKYGTTPKNIELVKKRLRTYLDITDGIMFAGVNHLDDKKRDRYGRNFSYKFYADALIPLFVSVLNEKKYQKKILGLSAGIGYSNRRSGNVCAEDRTRRLRKSFEIALSANPDFIVLPEWNEYNENTCHNPSVHSSFATQRIIKYYMSRIKKASPTQNPGDDLSVPNLILSYRRQIKLGEILTFELLNVPDADKLEKYDAQLILKNTKGKTVKEFPKTTFDKNILEEKCFDLPTESIPDTLSVRPELIVWKNGTRRKFSNFLYVRVRPTVCTIYQCVRQPLRDILKSTVSMNLRKNNDSSFRCEIDLRGTAKIAALELLRDQTEVAGYDTSNEFGLPSNTVFQITTLARNTSVLKGTLSIKNATSFIFRPSEHANKDFTKFQVKKDEIILNQRINKNFRSFFLAVPKRDINSAVLNLDLTIGKIVVPLKNVAFNGAYGKSLESGNVYIRIQKLDTLPDVPPIIGKSNFKCSLNIPIPENAGPHLYHLRAISTTGEILRTKPFHLPSNASSAGIPKTELRVFSDTLQRPIVVHVAKKRIPTFSYEFSDKCGDMLPTPMGPRWFGELGGGIKYGEPYNRNVKYDAKSANPTWSTEDGATCLKFDGKTQYVNFRRETLPRGAFTLEFEIKPTSSKPQILFRHHGVYPGSLVVKMKDEKLEIVFVGLNLKINKFKTNIAIPIDKWSKIKVTYDLAEITVSSGETTESFPLSARAHACVGAVFGGQLRQGFGCDKQDSHFEGYLKSLRIIHRFSR